jgi:hypothetical protein
VTATAANNNRVTTADWRARIETKLDLLTTQVGGELSEAKLHLLGWNRAKGSGCNCAKTWML